MRHDIKTGQLSLVDLQEMLEKNLATKYDASRDTVRKARNAVVSRIATGTFASILSCSP
jgi:DNA-binding GntR family transcriptional regulator